MQPVMEYIERNIREDIPIEELAKIAGISVPRFKANFRRLTGIPPREYILRRKVNGCESLAQNYRYEYYGNCV